MRIPRNTIVIESSSPAFPEKPLNYIQSKITDIVYKLGIEEHNIIILCGPILADCNILTITGTEVKERLYNIKAVLGKGSIGIITNHDTMDELLENIITKNKEFTLCILSKDSWGEAVKIAPLTAKDGLISIYCKDKVESCIEEITSRRP